MALKSLWLICLAFVHAGAQSSSSQSTGSSSSSSSYDSQALPTSFTQSFSTITTEIPVSDFTGSQYSYGSATGQSTVVTSTVAVGNGTSSSSSNSQITRTTSSQSLTEIMGATMSSNGTTASTSTTSAAPTNTVPCNNYPEFCTRKYSNVTEVCAHNSAFVVKNNAASNQAYPVTDQLNDGIRMVSGETHYVNNTIYNCHTSCDLLNAGPWQDYLTTIAKWVASHPYDVVTILIVNSNFETVDKYVPAIQNSGIAQYLYEPKYVPQRRDQWPTLGEMILSGKRVVMFMDYNANQTTVPYVLDEFTHMWETPFSPQNPEFPCDTQRPPKLNQTQARDDYMYVANHNLNVAVDISAILGNGGNDQILLPATSRLNVTNAEGLDEGMMGAMNLNCTKTWGRPPTFLLVDYYNIGSPMPGSVFEVAAQANNVTYRQTCCTGTSAAPTIRSSFAGLAAAVVFAVLLLN